MIYVTLPQNFKAIKNINGYFYNEEDDHLYSIKVSGILRKMKKYTTNYITYRMTYGKIPIGIKYYCISINGRHVNLYEDKLKKNIINDVTQIKIGEINEKP